MAYVPSALMPLYQQNQNNCSGFINAISMAFQLNLPAGRADDLIKSIQAAAKGENPTWVEIGTGPKFGPDAADYAGKGYLVLAMLKAAEHAAKKDGRKYESGHLAVVLNQVTSAGYPYLLSASNDPTGSGRSPGDKAVYGVGVGVWRHVDAPRVYYYRTAQPVPQLNPDSK